MSADRFQDIRGYLYNDLMMDADEATVITTSVLAESDITLEDPWDILSRILQEQEEGDPCTLSF